MDQQIADSRDIPRKAVRRRASRRIDGSPWFVIAAFLAPALLIYVGFTAYPVFKTFSNSLHLVKPNGVEEFIGLSNFRELFEVDRTFWIAVRNTLIWSVIEPILDVGTGLLLAVALYAKVPFARFFRIAWFTPALISFVVVAIMWTWIYNYDWGVVNVVLRSVGLGELAQPWLGNPNTALPALIVAHSWKWAGFNMVVCLAALHALPSEVLEASELDNCGWWEKLFFIIIPMIKPTLLNLLILSLIGKMKIFDLVWIMTRGGPMWSTETVSTYVYKRAFEWRSFDLGYPSAIAVVWFVVIISLVFLFSWLLRQRDKLEY